MATTKRICIIGPESSGKSELTKALAKHFNAPFVPEFAREYFAQKGTSKYVLADIEIIAQKQVFTVETAISAEPEILLCDTDLITLKIWAADKFGAKIMFVEENLKAQKADMYLLCKPDLPWQPDPLREDENRRDYLFEQHVLALRNLKFHYKVVQGQGPKRTANAVQFVNNFLAQNVD